MANLHKIGIFLVLLVFSAFCIDSVPAMEHKKVIQANHYYSDSQKQVTYNVANVEKQRSLIFVLRNKTTTQASKSVDKNPVNIQLKSGDQQENCRFDSYDDLCVIKQIKDNANISMLIKCDSLPCDISWTIFQPIVKTPSATQRLQQLYELSDSNKHMIAIISCNDPSVKTFYNDVKIYSNNQFQMTKSNEVIYYLFNNEKKGFMFAQVAEASRACANLAIYNVTDKIVVSQKTSVRDFVRNDSYSVFKVNQNPATDFMLDISIHELDKTQPMKSSLQVKVTGQNNGNRQTIQQYTIRPFSKKTQFEFKYLVKKIQSKYSNIQIEFKSTGNVIMLNYQLIADNRLELEVEQVAYFQLKTDQKLLIKVPGKSDAESNKNSHIYPSNTKTLVVSQNQCNLKSGCQFDIKASQNVMGSIYLGEGSQKAKQEIKIQEFKKQFTKRGRQGQTHYLKTPIVAKKAFQLVVNNPNVIVYAASEQKCPQNPSQNCYEKVFNFHHPVIFEPQGSGQLILAVQVLDNCQYTITKLQSNEQFIQLKQGQPFAYLMDDQQQKVIFKFKIDKKQPVNFNLISPLNSLYLMAQNGDKVPNSQQMNMASTDGYLTFNKNQVNKLEFTILIKKTEDHKDKFVHFTLIATTGQTNMRLEPGIAHYETFKPQEHKDFVFQFQPKQEYILTFYTHNAKAKAKIGLTLLVNNQDQWTNISPKHSFIIDKAADVLQLKDVSSQLCQKQGQQQCQIFVRIINVMDSQMDLTLNLMVKNSIVELKDGIWQSYAENTIATSSNFYFYPKHANKSIEILYKSVFTDLRIAYSIWKADDKNIDPTEWPFPKSIPSQSKQNQQQLFRPTKHISIDHQSLKSCWPSCVILVSLLKNSTKVVGQYQAPMLQNGQFSIMASNTYIQIPQKTKIDVVLKQTQSKYFMIDLKYALEKQDSSLTIFTSSTIGYYELKANVYSQKNARCPVDDGESDFRFGNLQTQIKVSTIQKKIQENQMGDDRNLYICILAKAYTNSKFSIEYTSGEQTIKILDMDSFETVSLSGKQSKMYQVSANQQYYIKFTRNKGFPFVNIIKCTDKDDFEKCLQSAQSTKQKGKQIVSKTQSFTQQPCQKCIIFVKISAQQPAELDIHLQSKYTQMQLKQNKMISDFTNENQQNRYTITALRNQETIINIQVTEGVVQAFVTDFNKINITKVSKDSSDKLIHIVIPAQDHQQDIKMFDRQVLGMPWLTPFGLSQTFSYLHLTIKAHQGKGATAYTLTYSSGERETYLQDGLVTDYVLEPQKETTFFYENKNAQGHGYLTISMQNSVFLHNLNLRMYYLKDQNDEDSAVQIPSDIPPMRKKTPNPTILYNLPAQNFIIIKMKCPAGTQQKVSLTVNHQQVILLPFNHQFPFPLHKRQSINLLIDINNPGYLKLILKKCDQSNPQFSYTFDYEGFQKGQFTYSSVLNDDPKFQYTIKAKEVGTLYVNIKSEEEDDSLVSVKAEYSPEKIKSISTKPGNKGIIDYQLLDSATAELTFTEVSCGSDSSSCKRQFDYYTISATQEQQLYSQTVCPTHYFNTAQIPSTNPLPLTKIKASADSNGKITFQYTLMDHISYVGVKGINSKTGEQIYYRPIQIVTIWGQISRTSTTHKFTIIGVSLFFLCSILIWCRRNARKGYKPLEQDD